MTDAIDWDGTWQDANSDEVSSMPVLIEDKEEYADHWRTLALAEREKRCETCQHFTPWHLHPGRHYYWCKARRLQIKKDMRCKKYEAKP